MLIAWFAGWHAQRPEGLGTPSTETLTSCSSSSPMLGAPVTFSSCMWRAPTQTHIKPWPETGAKCGSLRGTARCKAKRSPSRWSRATAMHASPLTPPLPAGRSDKPSRDPTSKLLQTETKKDKRKNNPKIFIIIMVRFKTFMYPAEACDWRICSTYPPACASETKFLRRRIGFISCVSLHDHHHQKNV